MKNKSVTYLGIFLALIGVVLFSTKAIFVKLAYEYGVDTITLLLLRMLFSMPVYVVVLVFLKKKTLISLKFKDYFWLFFFSFVGYYLASYFDFIGLRYIKAGLERVVLFVYPTLVLLLGRLFLKVKVTRAQLLAIVLTYIGVIIAFYNELSYGGNEVYIGVSFVFFSALTYAMYLVGSGWLLPRFGVLRYTSYAMLAATFCVFVHYLSVPTDSLFSYESEVYYLGGAMALFSTVIPSFFVSKAIKMIGSGNFSIIGSVGPITTLILANIFLGELFSSHQIIGTVIVITGVLLLSRSEIKKSNQI
ncbi:MAG: DMT family transporter [Flavicella sp.]